MEHSKKTFILLILLTITVVSWTFAQDYFKLNPVYSLNTIQKSAQARLVMQNDGYANAGCKRANANDNPLMLDGKPLDYSIFNLKTKGELTVVKQDALTGQTTEVPFYIYVRRTGNSNILIPGKERPDISQVKVDISEILQHAKPWDQLVIEPVRREDAAATRVLVLLGGGC